MERVAEEGAAGMTDEPDCERCRRIKSAIEQGHSRDSAREAHGWDECSQDDCPMLPRPYSCKTHAYDASARRPRNTVDQSRR